MKPIFSALIVIVFSLFTSFSLAFAKAPPAEMFGKNARISDAALSPDATELAIIETFEGAWIVRIIDLENSATPPRVVIGEELSPIWIKWANDKQVLVNISQSTEYRRLPIQVGAIYTLNTDSMKGKILIKSNKYFRQFDNNVVDFLSDDPDHILMAFTNDDSNNERPDVKKVNVATGQSQTLVKGRQDVQWWHTDLTGTVRVGQGLDDNHKDEIRYRMILRDQQSDKWQDSKKYVSTFTGLPPIPMR